MITTLLISRIEEWFIYEDTNVSPYYYAILLLKKLSTRRKMGCKYNRIQLLNTLTGNRTREALKTLDISIVLLLSRGLIEIVETKAFSSKIFITEKGIAVLDKYREEIKIDN